MTAIKQKKGMTLGTPPRPGKSVVHTAVEIGQELSERTVVRQQRTARETDEIGLNIGKSERGRQRLSSQTDETRPDASPSDCTLLESTYDLEH